MTQGHSATESAEHTAYCSERVRLSKLSAQLTALKTTGEMGEGDGKARHPNAPRAEPRRHHPFALLCPDGIQVQIRIQLHVHQLAEAHLRPQTVTPPSCHASAAVASPPRSAGARAHS